MRPTPRIGESKATQFSARSTREERAAQSKFCRVPALNTQVSACMCGNYLKPGKESAKRMKSSSAQGTLRAKKSVCVLQADWKPEDPQGTEHNIQRHLLLMGNN